MLISVNFFNAFKLSIAAISSILLLVVSTAPPEISFRFTISLFFSANKTAPQPPTPGLPEQAPSVYALNLYIKSHNN